MKSIGAIGRGILLSLLVGLLLVFGIMWPIFQAFFSQKLIPEAGWIVVMLAFACAVAFYFGGMISGYHAPSRRRLHGTLVAPVTFLISPIVNMATGKGPFPEAGTIPGAPILILVFLAVAAVAAFVGSRRGEALHDHHENYLRRRQAAERTREAHAQAREK